MTHIKIFQIIRIFLANNDTYNNDIFNGSLFKKIDICYNNYSYSYFELSNNTRITISNDDLSNLHMDSLNTVMINKGYDNLTVISRMIIGRNIKEISNMQTSDDSLYINNNNSFSIIFLPRESNDVIIIKDYAFLRCETLIDVTFTNYMNIGVRAFQYTGIIHLDLTPIKNYTILKQETFSEHPNLKSINFGRYLQKIERNFYLCPQLLEIIIPPNITEIKSIKTFENNVKLTTVKFLKRDNPLIIADHSHGTHGVFRNNKMLENVYYDERIYNSKTKFVNDTSNIIQLDAGIFNDTPFYYSNNIYNYTSTWDPIKTSKLIIRVYKVWSESYIDKNHISLSSFQLKVDISDGYINYPWKDSSINGLSNPFYQSTLPQADAVQTISASNFYQLNQMSLFNYKKNSGYDSFIDITNTKYYNTDGSQYTGTIQPTNNKNICCLTMKNLYNNIIYNKNSNLPDTAHKIIFLSKDKKQNLITNISNNITISDDINISDISEISKYNYIFDTGNTSKSLNKIKLHKDKNVENIRDISNNLFFKYIDETRYNTNSLKNKLISISDDVLDSIDNYKGYNIMSSTIFYYKNINFDNCSNIIEYFNIANKNHNDICFNNSDNPYYIDNSSNSNLRERFFNINDIFNTNELKNYAYYFNKNLLNYNNKLNEKNINNTLLDIYTDASDIKIFNNNNKIENVKLNDMNLSNRFKFDFDPITNIIIFFNQLYVDISDLNITTVNSDINKDNNLYNKNLTDNNKKYFTEITSIYKHFKLDISSVIIDPIDGILFDNKIIELRGKILDASNNPNRDMNNILYSLFNTLNPNSSDLSYNIIDNELNNRIFLSIKDNINSNNSNLIGLTEGNFNNNITVSNDFIYFTQYYENNYINYQVNNNELSLNYVLQNDISYSNNRFLIDNSKNKNNYNCLKDSNINSLLKDLSSNLLIDYYVENEISETNIIIRNISNNYFMKPIYLNNSSDSSYGKIINADNTYDIISNNLHSHSNIIDLNDFININNIGTNINFFNPNNLKYIIKDLSYNENFNIIDLNEEELSKDINLSDIKKTKTIMV